MMGCSSGKSSHSATIFNSAEFKADLKKFERLRLNTKDSCTLYQIYDKMLSEGRKTISPVELLECIGLPSKAFTKELFSILNARKPEELDFRGFVICVWNYCTLTRDNMGEPRAFCYCFINQLNPLVNFASQTCSCLTCMISGTNHYYLMMFKRCFMKYMAKMK